MSLFRLIPERLLFRQFIADVNGSNAIEYSMLAALTAITCMAVLTHMSGEIVTGWASIGNAMNEATTQ